MTINPHKVRPRRDWVLVLSEQRRSMFGGGLLYVPAAETGIEKVTEGVGIIIRVGDGKKNAALGIETADRVAFRSYLKYANKLDVGERWPDGSEKFYSLISSDDIIAVVPEGVDVGIFSDRAQTKKKK